MRRFWFLRRCMFALFLLLALATPALADEATPTLTPGFQHLLDTAPDVVGSALESERGGDNADSTVLRTTTGLLYWEPGLTPTWTNGNDRLTLDVADQVVKWVGDLLKPPQLKVEAPFFSSGGPNPRLLGLDARIYCIEGIESHHGTAMYNPVDINGRLNGPGPHAAGWLGWLPGTAARWGAFVGNRDSEWAAAKRMFNSTSEAFMRGQFYGVGAGLC